MGATNEENPITLAVKSLMDRVKVSATGAERPH
jgi:hypothetical protein